MPDLGGGDEVDGLSSAVGACREDNAEESALSWDVHHLVLAVNALS